MSGTSPFVSGPENIDPCDIHSPYGLDLALVPEECGGQRALPARTASQQIPAGSLQLHPDKETASWFEEANLNVASRSNIAAGIQNESPFFLSDSAEIGGQSNYDFVREDPILSYMRSNVSENENEELRGIIDDLTVANKKLKRKLRQYRAMDPPQLQEDKLFEVRAYGLSTGRKRELEGILKDFAMGKSSPLWTRTTRKISLEKRPSVSREEAKMKLVVTRLEQLFMQQQGPAPKRPVPEEALLAIEPVTVEHGSFEKHGELQQPSSGSCQVPVLSHDTDIDGEHEITSLRSEAAGLRTARKLADDTPIRPVDLEVRRNQDPRSNIEYIRRLNLPNLTLNDLQAEENDGWVYLNLLMNMAQLHTLNVTDKFVRDSVRRFSRRFELSPDGCKIRWKRSAGKSHSACESSFSHTSDDDEPEDPKDGESPLQASTHSLHSSSTSSRILPLGLYNRGEGSRTVHKIRISGEQDCDYKPVVFTGSDSEQEDRSLDSESDECEAAPYRSTRKHTTEGSMVFYRNAPFCSDLTGDQPEDDDMDLYPPSTPPEKRRRHRRDERRQARRFDRFSSLAMGNSQQEAAAITIAADRSCDIPTHHLPRFNLDTPTSPSPPINDEPHPQPIDLEASGIGGVLPRDNFAIHVQVKHSPAASFPGRGLARSGSPVPDASIPRRYEPHIISTTHVELPPSPLPPATCAFYSSVSSSSGDVDGDGSSSLDGYEI